MQRNGMKRNVTERKATPGILQGRSFVIGLGS
jgi:hypothetical protein